MPFDGLKESGQINSFGETPPIFKKKLRPRQDSNLESPDPKSDALSIRPRGHIR